MVGEVVEEVVVCNAVHHLGRYFGSMDKHCDNHWSCCMGWVDSYTCTGIGYNIDSVGHQSFVELVLESLYSENVARSTAFAGVSPGIGENLQSQLDAIEATRFMLQGRLGAAALEQVEKFLTEQEQALQQARSIFASPLDAAQ